MEKFILMPDSFKGTMDSATVCAVMRKAILRRMPDAEIISIPVADGGEGTVDCFVSAIGAQKIACRAVSPFGEPMDSFYALLDDGTAVVEMAAAAGLPLVEGRADTMIATTYGVGMLLQDALQRGAKKIILGLGGSATTDGGVGAAAALGAVFLDRDGNAFVPTGGTLCDIASLEISALRTKLRGIQITAMCDIDNPLCGTNGAAHVFAPQKGASPEQVLCLDAGLSHLAQLFERELGCSVAQVPGAGAAGGMGAGVLAFFGGVLQGGIDAVLDTVHFETLLSGTSLVFTGEGKMDRQSLRGKVVLGIARRAKRAGVPVIAVVGGAEEDLEEAYAQGVSAVFPINRLAVDFEISRHRSCENLRDTMDNILRLYQLHLHSPQ
ncbi:MAG: glycerate kinase [Ruthenibacterium sp.]